MLRALGDGGTLVLTPGPHPTYTCPCGSRAMEPALGALDAVLELLQSPDRRQPSLHAFCGAAEQFDDYVGEMQHDKCSTEQRTRAIRWVGAPPRPLCPACAPAHLRTCAPVRYHFDYYVFLQTHRAVTVDLSCHGCALCRQFEHLGASMLALDRQLVLACLSAH